MREGTAPRARPSRRDRSTRAGSAAVVASPFDTSGERSPGRLLAAGESAPDFEGIAHTGMRVRLSAFGPDPVVVLFFPDDRDAASVAVLREFRDDWLEFSGVL